MASPPTFSTGHCRRCATWSARDPVNHPVQAGEIITTGTLTRAMPVRAGETWSTTLDGIPLDGITLRFT
jgi:2-oxo-3-hexenedioate decarboxylase